jgi:hypothetical protein
MTDSVQVFPPGFRLVDASGVPYAGASIEFYDAGTTTPKTAFSDQALTTALGVVVYTDAYGYPVAASGSSAKVLVYVDTADYKVVLKDALGATIATHDDIKGAVISGDTSEEASTITQAQADARYMRNPNALSTITNIVDADILGIWDASAGANVGITWDNIKENLEAEGVVIGEGAVVPFHNSAAPTGWTKITSSDYNDAALRFTTGNGGGTGGSAAFTSVFTSRTITQANLPNVTWSDTLALNGSQTGGLVRDLEEDRLAFYGAGGVNGVNDIRWSTTTLSLSGSVTSGGSGQSLNFAVKYADLILCTKSAI